ncbi:RNA pyrophosphohydrolase [Methylocapsa sp. S129]|uniref:RNA pyrophosphohydrolase n=1 Tax=Methylocapsa sp. S129 TaxID=1641869 RepID=UPI00131B0551|nr:RNA pyrophosphohydrolase [Methylocapsa sp. S129]
MTKDELPYRRNVGAAVFNRAGEVFLGRRKKRRGGMELVAGHEWQMPQGGIDEGEAPLEAARRELFEETNISHVALLAEAPDWLSYDLPPEALAGRWKGRYRGQTQKWFAFRFEGDDSEIDIDRPGGGAFEPEFEAWRWAPLETLPGLIVSFKRPVYEAVVAAFKNLIARP